MMSELRPKKELLDPQFNGYKLSLDPIAVYRQSITEGVDHLCQSDDQYSFIHTKVFSLHNHLFSNPWYVNTVFFINKQWQLHKATINTETGRVEVPQTVWTLPHQNQRRPGHFNANLMFPSPETAVLSDGCGRLHILNCNSDTQWQSECCSEVVGCDSGCLLMSTRLAADSSLHCVLMTLETAMNTSSATATSPIHSNKPRPATINTVLHWITYTKDNTDMWSVSCTRRLEGAGSVDYVALEASCLAVYIVTTAGFRFTADSVNPVPSPDEEMDVGNEKPLYTWEQTEDDIKVLVDVGAEVTRDNLEIVVTEKELSICCQKQMIENGALSDAVDTNLTTWSLQPGRLEVMLTKQHSGVMWAELVAGSSRGQQVVDPAFVETVHSRLGHLCSDTEVQETGEEYAPTFNLDQLEECDSAPEDTRSLVRLDATTHTISHQVSLVGHQWLMSISQDPEAVPCVCVRHDVDGCVWQLDCPTDSNWPCQHIGTFCALGYVAASKQQRKFIVAAPDLSYSVICEAINHVFVYRKASVVNGELRNRKTSAKVATVAKQQLINLESQSPVLGAHASNSHLFILTADTLYTFHIQ